MEVLVGMALMGMCVAILLGLVADHIRLTRKLTERGKKVLQVINKAEEASLGILGEGFDTVGDRKIWRGKTKDGLPWKVVESASTEDKGILLYDVSSATISLLSVGLQKQKSDLNTER
jgi:hypothetical protein